MNFKNVCVYRVKPEAIPNIGAIEDAMKELPFYPCGATEPHRVGWAFAADIDETPHCGLFTRRTPDSSAILIRLREQRRILPPAVLREQLEDQVKTIQEREGRKLGKKEIARLKDELIFTLLPRAFTKTGDTLALIYPTEGLLLVGTQSLSRAELLLNALRLALGSLPVSRPAFSAPITTHLSAWLQAERLLPDGFSIGDSCEIVDEEGAIRCSHIDLNSDEVRKHMDIGREAKSLALSFQDSLSFTLTADARLTKLKLSERLIGELDEQYSGDRLANFDAELLLWSSSLLRLVKALFPAIGEIVK